MSPVGTLYTYCDVFGRSTSTKSTICRLISLSRKDRAVYFISYAEIELINQYYIRCREQPVIFQQISMLEIQRSAIILFVINLICRRLCNRSELYDIVVRIRWRCVTVQYWKMLTTRRRCVGATTTLVDCCSTTVILI